MKQALLLSFPPNSVWGVFISYLRGAGINAAQLTVALLMMRCMQTCPEPDMIDQASTLMFALAGDFEAIFAADVSGEQPQLAWKELQHCSRVFCMSRHAGLLTLLNCKFF